MFLSASESKEEVFVIRGQLHVSQGERGCGLHPKVGGVRGYAGAVAHSLIEVIADDEVGACDGRHKGFVVTCEPWQVGIFVAGASPRADG